MILGNKIIDGINWEWGGLILSGSIMQGKSEKGIVTAYRNECDLHMKISDSNRVVRNFMFSKFANDLTTYFAKRDEYMLKIAKGLSNNIAIDDIIKNLDSNLCIKEVVDYNLDNFRSNIRGYSWRKITSDFDINWGLFDCTWQTAADKKRPTLSVRLFEKGDGVYVEELGDSNGMIQRVVGREIVNRYEAFKRMQETMLEWTLLHAPIRDKSKEKQMQTT